jgi:hypothetical protein
MVAQTRTLRIRLNHSLDLSNVGSISPLRAYAILPRSDFHDFSRAGGPKGLNRVHPTCTERQSLNKECGWKGGDRGGLAEWGQFGKRRRKKKKNRLDTHRPTHGRTWSSLPVRWIRRQKWHGALLAAILVQKSENVFGPDLGSKVSKAVAVPSGVTVGRINFQFVSLAHPAHLC